MYCHQKVTAVCDAETELILSSYLYVYVYLYVYISVICFFCGAASAAISLTLLPSCGRCVYNCKVPWMQIMYDLILINISTKQTFYTQVNTLVDSRHYSCNMVKSAVWFESWKKTTNNQSRPHLFSPFLHFSAKCCIHWSAGKMDFLTNCWWLVTPFLTNDSQIITLQSYLQHLLLKLCDRPVDHPSTPSNRWLDDTMCFL